MTNVFIEKLNIYSIIKLTVQTDDYSILQFCFCHTFLVNKTSVIDFKIIIDSSRRADQESIPGVIGAQD